MKTLEIEFTVQGSSPEPYNVTFTKKGDKLSAFCTCPAGVYGLHCKHRINILSGITKGIVSKNLNDVETIKKWLTNTEVETALNELKAAEKAYNKARKKLADSKKKITNALMAE